MKNLTYALFVFCIQFIYCYAISNNGNNTLIFAHTLCRHGYRNLLAPYPNDPYADESHWQGGIGALTNYGKRQHFKLGKYLRKRYQCLLEDGVYSPNKVYVQATDTDRAIMSAEACMAGMFPPTASQKWKKTLNWHPIPVHTIPRREDHLLASEKRCDHFDDVMLQYMNTTAYTDLFTKHKTLISYLERNSGMKLSTITEIYLLYDALWVEKMEGKRLPDWAENVMKSGGDFEYLAICYFKIYSETTEMKKLKSGFLLKEIFDRFTSKIQSNLSPDRSLVMYFAHDITITNMLSSLGLYKLHQPKYASCMFFQLYSSDEMPYVKIFYRKSGNVVNIKPLNIPNCGSKCPLEKLYELYQHILPTQQFDKECALRDGHTLPPGGNPENAPY